MRRESIVGVKRNIEGERRTGEHRGAWFCEWNNDKLKVAFLRIYTSLNCRQTYLYMFDVKVILCLTIVKLYKVKLYVWLYFRQRENGKGGGGGKEGGVVPMRDTPPMLSVCCNCLSAAVSVRDVFVAQLEKVWLVISFWLKKRNDLQYRAFRLLFRR